MAAFKIKNGQDKYYDLNAKSDVIHYILNPKKAPHYYGGYNIESDDPVADMMNITKKFKKEKGVQLWHFIVSFAPSEITEPSVAYYIATELAKYFSASFQIIYAIHEDTSHIHIHFVKNSVSFIDGHRYNCNHDEFHRLYQYFENVLRLHGIHYLAYVSNKTTSEFLE